MLGDEIARALQNGTRLTENECDGAEVGGAEQIRDEVLDDRDQLGSDGAVGLQLEQIEQHREDVAAQVLRVLPLDVLLEVCDLGVLQKVERGVEVIDRDQALALGRRLRLHRGAHGARRRRRDGLARFDRRRVLTDELAERVADERTLPRPEQPGQAIRGTGLAIPVSSATMETSLSPRPLSFSKTRSPGRHGPRCASTQGTAWALSTAGRIPSSRDSEANASSACRSVTASYNTRPLSFR